MCLARAYLSANGGSELLLEEVASLKIEGEMLHLRTLFGEQREIAAALREVDFQSSTITLEMAAGG
ncbi:CooT family nickel-binding protein [Dehalococcoidia bacterium]|nr:CooT family nickel-binding protein [Dehalococcoidia bacterium]MCL0092266.1 CooT family nickel-binding protein [Dehalococcoidia bacterium]MCL0095244.1 CooT family nickel-binding protein [Dehalococcoidia bacterium]